jgi:nucleotide-binding universal stress UspA family protein
MKSNITIFTNGYDGTWNSIQFGAWLAKAFTRPVTLVGVIEHDDDDHPVEEMFSRAIALFREAGVEYRLEVEDGSVEQAARARRALIDSPKSVGDPEHIILLGPFGRNPMKKMLLGRSFRYFMELFGQPIAYIQEFRLPIKKILLCVGGLGYTIQVEPLVLELAKADNADVTLFTVIPPGDLDYPEARIVRQNWQHLQETDTVIGRTLRLGLEMARNAGVAAVVKTSHGSILEEIKNEIKEGDYDLVVMGSQFSSHTLRQFYAPNVTADIAEVCTTPILTVRNASSGD